MWERLMWLSFKWVQILLQSTISEGRKRFSPVHRTHHRLGMLSSIWSWMFVLSMTWYSPMSSPESALSSVGENVHSAQLAYAESTNGELVFTSLTVHQRWEKWQCLCLSTDSNCTCMLTLYRPDSQKSIIGDRWRLEECNSVIFRLIFISKTPLSRSVHSLNVDTLFLKIGPEIALRQPFKVGQCIKIAIDRPSWNSRGLPCCNIKAVVPLAQTRLR